MNSTRTVIIIIIVFIVALFLGFLIGSKRVGDLRRELASVKAEFEMKVATLQDDLAKATAQKDLAVCKWELVQARTSASRRDFGRATESLDAARSAFERATSAANEDFRQKLSPLGAGFDEIKADLDKNDVKVVGKFEEIINQIDLLIAD